MQIRHLEYFVTLAEEEHFGRAAQMCGVSQPTLSLAIKKLEDDLGAALIIRGKRYMGLTAEGERILPWGRQILSDFNNLRDDLSGRRRGGLTGVLHLGIHPAAMALTPRLTEQFESRNPLATISITQLDTPAILSGIAGTTLDGGIVWARDEAYPNVDQTPLGTQSLMFVCPADHPFAGEVSVPWRDALTQPLIALKTSLPVPEEQDQALSAHARIGCGSLAAILAHMRTGQWCAVVPSGFSALLPQGDDLILRPVIQPSVSLSLVGLVSARSPQSPMVRALSACLHSISAA